MTHLWFLFSAWSFFSLCRPLARFEVNILPLDMLWLLQAACLPLHCPFQLPLLLLPPGMAPALCLWVHRERTATLSAGTRHASPDTVCPREDKRAAPAPGKSWRSLCRPGNRASGAGRTGPAGRAAARLRTLPNGGFWRSPKERRPCEGSACNCWLADPCRRARSVEWVSSEMQLFGSGASQPGKYPLQHVHTNTSESTFAKSISRSMKADTFLQRPFLHFGVTHQLTRSQSLIQLSGWPTTSTLSSTRSFHSSEAFLTSSPSSFLNA